MRNIEIYREIGLEQDFETIELLDDDAYRALYRDPIVDRDRLYPVFPDARMWPGRSSTLGGLFQCGSFGDLDSIGDVDPKQLGVSLSAADSRVPHFGRDAARDPAIPPQDDPLLQSTAQGADLSRAQVRRTCPVTIEFATFPSLA
jgi:hypothetical protein